LAAQLKSVREVRAIEGPQRFCVRRTPWWETAEHKDSAQNIESSRDRLCCASERCRAPIDQRRAAPYLQGSGHLCTSWTLTLRF
jgi:hypothetical protein